MSLEAHLASVEPFLQRYGYGAVFVSTLVEGFGIPAPGQTMLVAGAVLAGRGEFSIEAILATSAVASAAGGLVGWAIGRFGGRRLLARVASAARLGRIEELFHRWGYGVVLLGRFVDGTRQLNGIAAGAFGMPFATFLLWNVLGAVLWTVFWGAGAYVLGRDFGAIAHFFHQARPVALVATTLVVVALIVWLVREERLRRGAAEKSGD